jgi:hypothetical protein
MRRCLTFAVMAATVMLTGCCSDKSVEQRLRSLSGPDYLGLQRGQVHQAVTPEAWVAYRVVRAKDEQILDLLEALHKCQARSAMAPSVQPMAPGVPAASPDPAATLQYIIPAAPMPQEPVVVPQKLGN